MTMTYTFSGFYIPDNMMAGLRRYIDHGVAPGNFLSAVLQNNLKEAVGRADRENMQNLPAYVGFLYNEAPALCWGSPEQFNGWLAMHALRRANEQTERP
jgi:hypothetical protein